MRGDSYQLQGQQGGVLIENGDSVDSKFRSILVLSAGDLIVTSPNVFDTFGDPVTTSTGVLAAGTVLNGVFTYIEISGVGSKAICYYGDVVPALAVAPAYTLGWQAQGVLASSTNNNIVILDGVLKQANRFGQNQSNITLNGVTFTWSSYGSIYEDADMFTAIGSSTAEMQLLLRNVSYDIPSNSISLTGFIVNKTYMLQWFSCDERTGPNSTVQNRTQTVEIAGYSNTIVNSQGKSLRCNFVATQTNITLFVGQGSELELLTAFQIRQLD